MQYPESEKLYPCLSGFTKPGFLNLVLESTLHLILRLSGGGFLLPTEPQDNQMMSIAAGGRIKRFIIPDSYPNNIWRTGHLDFCNSQLVNSAGVEEITKLRAPPSPIGLVEFSGRDRGARTARRVRDPSPPPDSRDCGDDSGRAGAVRRRGQPGDRRCRGPTWSPPGWCSP